MQGAATGIGDTLRRCHEAGKPVAAYKTVDDAGSLGEASLYDAVTIYRAKLDNRDTPPGNWQGDPVQVADAWMDAQIAHWRAMPFPADYVEPINEPDPGTLEGYRWLNAFTLHCMDRAEHAGYHLALYSFATGVPELDEFKQLLPSLEHAARRAHVLSLHEYGMTDESAGWDGTMRSTEPWLALRYRMYYKLVLNPAGLGALPLYITECAPFGGFDWDAKGPQAFLADTIWYDQELQKDHYVRGCCLFTLGGGRWQESNYQDVLPQLTDYMVGEHAPPDEPPPDEPPTEEPPIYYVGWPNEALRDGVAGLTRLIGIKTETMED